MEPLHPLRLKWGMVLLVLAHLLLVAGSSHAQEAQRVFEPMRGLGNDLGGSDRPSAPRAYENQQAPSPVTMPTRPETPATALTFVVTTTADTGSGSFRRAIDSANGNPGIDVIEFNIGGGGVQTITPLTALPYFTGPIIIDGTTQPGYAGSPLIELNGGSAPQGTNGLYLVGGNSLVAALTINRFKSFPAGGNGYAIVLDVGGGNIIVASRIGLNVAGTAALPNGSGLGIFGASGGNRIGGTDPGSGNVISGNLYTGVAIATGSVGGNFVLGNAIGTNAAGNAVIGNGDNGIYVDAPNNTVGGVSLAAGNIVSGNTLPGIFIGTAGSGNIVQGNFVGLNRTGTANLGTPSNGLNIRSANNIIGDASIEGRNIIVGSGSAAIYVFGPAATGNTILNNVIGVDPDENIVFPNNKGIVFDNAPGNTVDGNFIGGSTLYGIDILNAGASGNKIISNVIGPDRDDPTFGNGSHGIQIAASQDTVMQNIIAHNGGSGVYVSSGTGNLITENSMFANTGRGIDLAPQGLARNDSLDGDSGPNNLQNFPILDSARVEGDHILIHYRLNTTPHALVYIDFYTNDDYDQSPLWRGAILGPPRDSRNR